MVGVVVLVVLVVLAFVPRRNRYIQSVVLFGGNSILPLPGCSESSGRQFLLSIGFQWFSIEIRVTTDLPQILPQGVLGSTF